MTNHARHIGTIDPHRSDLDNPLAAVDLTACYPADDTYTTVPAIAAQLGISRMTVYRLVHSGELCAIRIDRTLRVPETCYRRFLARRRVVPDAADCQ